MWTSPSCWMTAPGLMKDSSSPVIVREITGISPSGQRKVSVPATGEALGAGVGTLDVVGLVRPAGEGAIVVVTGAQPASASAVPIASAPRIMARWTGRVRMVAPSTTATSS